MNNREQLAQFAERRKAVQETLARLVQGPMGDDVLWYIANELGVLDVEGVMGKDTHDTYFNLGKRYAFDVFNTLKEYRHGE